jgi:hypothetical protein
MVIEQDLLGFLILALAAWGQFSTVNPSLAQRQLLSGKRALLRQGFGRPGSNGSSNPQLIAVVQNRGNDPILGAAIGQMRTAARPRWLRIPI